MKTKVYIFNGRCRGAQYGIGTYIGELRSALERNGIDYGFVNVYATGSTATMTEESGHCHINIPAVPDMTRMDLYSRNVAYLLHEFIQEEKDVKLIFHLNFMTDPMLVRALKKSFRHCKVVLVAHYTNWSFDLMGDQARLAEILTKPTRKLTASDKVIRNGFKADVKMIQKVDRFVCIARHTLEPYLEYGKVDPKKCQVIYNGLADEYLPKGKDYKELIRAKYHIGMDEQLILFVGRLDAVKGLQFLIQSFRSVMKTHDKARLVLIGDGDYNSWLGYASDCWTKVTFTGRLRREQVKEFYHIADVGVVCSLHEEFGLVAIEMMMHRLPVVVSNAGGLDEIIEDNVSGLKVPVVSADGQRVIETSKLTESIYRLLDDRAFAETIARHGRKRYQECFSSTVFSGKMVELYKSL